MDSSHPCHDSSAAKRWGNAIRDVCAYADSIVEELMGQLGEQDALVVVSDHRGGPLHRAVHLNSWLRQKGYLVSKGLEGAAAKAERKA